MNMIHRALTIALTMVLLMLGGQVADAGQWPKKSQWGWQCLNNTHCKAREYDGKPAVCRKKVNTNNEWVSRNQYCLKALWEGAPCDNPDQCASGNCDRGRCEEKEIYVTEVDIAEDATKPTFNDFDNLKKYAPPKPFWYI